MSGRDISERLQRLSESIAESVQSSGRTDTVSLVAVTKTVEVARIRQAFEAGQRVFGENRVQEAAGKLEALGNVLPGAKWHLIGHLQRNKAKAAVELFSLVESVDSMRIASELDVRAEAAGVRLPVLLELNVAGEGSKSGFAVDELEDEMPRLLRLPHLLLAGLMTIAPLAKDPEDVRWVFRRLRELRDGLRERHDAPHFAELSMGMSNDYRVAIQEGATMVRIGRLLFGDRPATTPAGDT